jgi:hypothetical protein
MLASGFRYGWEEARVVFGGADELPREKPGITPGLPNLWSGKGDRMINLWLRAVIKFLMTLEVKLRIRWIR